MTEEWKTVRLRGSLHARMTKFAADTEQSTASAIEQTLEVGLRRSAINLPAGLQTLRHALADAEEHGASLAAQMLRLAVEREERTATV
jgi:hypothetical protein